VEQRLEPSFYYVHRSSTRSCRCPIPYWICLKR
jgi:hypothetical protein